MSSTLAGKIWIGFGLSAAAMIVVTALSLMNEFRAAELDELDHRTRQIILDAGSLVSHVKDAETGARGYIITGAVSHLESYERAISATPVLIGDLKGNIPPESVQRERMDAIEKLLAMRMSQLERTVGLRRDRGFEAARQFVLNDEDRRAMEQMRGIVSELIAVQTELVEQGQAKVVDLRRKSTISIVTGAVVVVIVVFLTSLNTLLSILRRRNDLVHGAGKLAEGNLAHRIPVVTRDELSVLAQRFNDMADAIQKGSVRLQAANERLSRNAATLRMLGAMVQRLQESTSIEEFGHTIQRFAPEVMLGRRGALLLGEASRSLVAGIVQWGSPLATEMQFTPSDCWALRRGQSHVYSPSDPEVRCQHVRPEFDGITGCIPLMGHGTLAGLIYLEFEAGLAAEPATAGPLLDDSATAFCESVAVSLANFRMREAQRLKSIRDPLTALFNRRYLDETLELEFARARRSRSPLCVIMSDIDNFKRVNDTWGHDCGDLVLRSIADLLSAHTRKGDVACRYGGEEFTLVMPGTTVEVACDRAEVLRRAIREQRIEYAGKPLEPVTMSFGVACFPDHGETPDEVMKAADEALFRAKQDGRDRVVLAVEAQTTAASVPVAR